MKKWEPHIVNGECYNGCLPLNESSWKRQVAMTANAVSLPEYSWVNRGDMPIIKWDGVFDTWLDNRIELAETYRDAGYCMFPWSISENLPQDRRGSDIIHWNQGFRPSCCLHGETHAYQFTELISIGLGATYKYEALNPIVPFYLAKGGSLAGGLDLVTCAEFVNGAGQYPTTLVGDDNINVPLNYRAYMTQAKNWQAGIVYIEDNYAERIFKACKALLAVNFASGQWYNSFQRDGNGIKIMAGLASGGHAQCFCGWRECRGQEYIFCHNSHGDIYGQSDEGEPAWGAWVNTRQMRTYMADTSVYGNPFIVFAEGEYNFESMRLRNDFPLPKYPRNWRR